MNSYHSLTTWFSEWTHIDRFWRLQVLTLWKGRGTAIVVATWTQSIWRCWKLNPHLNPPTVFIVRNLLSYLVLHLDRARVMLQHEPPLPSMGLHHNFQLHSTTSSLLFKPYPHLITWSAFPALSPTMSPPYHKPYPPVALSPPWGLSSTTTFFSTPYRFFHLDPLFQSRVPCTITSHLARAPDKVRLFCLKF